jgi:prepilin-type N-terminal cleavage/methylation domain-containing protein
VRRDERRVASHGDEAVLSAADASERGFTLIELLIAMFLSAIVLALVITLVVGSFRSGDRTEARTKALRAATEASEQLTSDIRSLRAPQRDPYYTGSPDQFRAMLLRADNPEHLEIHDIVAANATTLTFYADVLRDNPGVECVTWQQRADRSLRRIVRPYTRDCAGSPGALQDRELVPALPASAAAAAAPPAPFSYRRLVQPRPTAATIDPSACTSTRSASTSNVLQRDQITGVELDLRAFTVQRDGAGDQEYLTTVAIGSRQGIEYKYALGCAA